jgi:hypothetical protein
LKALFRCFSKRNCTEISSSNRYEKRNEMKKRTEAVFSPKKDLKSRSYSI